MSEQDDIAGLVRAVRARVPMDAAQMLVKETPERIGAVLAELPQILVDRIKAYLPPELQLQASESLAEVKENTVGEMMDPALAVLPQTTTVQEAIAFLRNHETPQQITYLYVTDAEDKLIGLTVIRDLILAEPNQTLTDVMLPEPFALDGGHGPRRRRQGGDSSALSCISGRGRRPTRDRRGARLAPVRASGDRDQRAVGPDGRCGQGGASLHGDLDGFQDAPSLAAGEPVDRFRSGLRGQPFRGHHHADRGARGFPADPCGPKRQHRMPGAGDHAARNHPWGPEQPSCAQVDREGADPWRNEWFADGYRRWRGDVVAAPVEAATIRRWSSASSSCSP